MLRLYIIKM